MEGKKIEARVRHLGQVFLLFSIFFLLTYRLFGSEFFGGKPSMHLRAIVDITKRMCNFCIRL